MKGQALTRAIALLLVACSSAAPGSTDVVIASDSGALRIDAHAIPEPLGRGNGQVELTITNASDGSARDGLSIQVVPWMPAMDHGTSVAPEVTAEGQGKYLLTQLELFMPGLWELRMTFSGPLSDRAAPAFEIP
jgi:YtkA-like protein